MNINLMYLINRNETSRKIRRSTGCRTWAQKSCGRTGRCDSRLWTSAWFSRCADSHRRRGGTVCAHRTGQVQRSHVRASLVHMLMAVMMMVENSRRGRGRDRGRCSLELSTCQTFLYQVSLVKVRMFGINICQLDLH